MIFSAIFISWITIATSMNQDSFTILQNIKRALIVSNIFFFVMSITQIILLLASVTDKYIFLWIEIVWSSLMLLCAICFGFYGCKMISMILETAQRMQILHAPGPSRTSAQQQTNGTDEFRIAKKLGLVAVVIVIFFLIQCLLTLYFLMDFNEITTGWRIVDLLSHLICLSIICFMYHKTITTLRNKLVPKRQLCPKKPAKSNVDRRRATVGSTTDVDPTRRGPIRPSIYSERESVPQKEVPPISPTPRADSIPKFKYDVEMQSK